MDFILVLASFFTFSWISRSVCQFHTVSVRPAESVTLLCTNYSRFPSHIWWFKMNGTTNSSRISSMSSPGPNVTLYDGFNYDKYKMTSNITNIFLKIKEVNFTDSGLYFCGPWEGVPKVFSAVYLQVEDWLPKLPSMVLGCIIAVLTVIIVVLVVKIKTIQTGQTDGRNPQHTENLDPDGLNYAALNFRPKAKSDRRLPDEKEMRENVLYAATR